MSRSRRRSGKLFELKDSCGISSDGTCPNAGKAPMWARCGVCQKKQESQTDQFFQMAGKQQPVELLALSSAIDLLCRPLSPGPSQGSDEASRSLPAMVTRGTIARIRAHRRGPDRPAPHKFNNLRAAQFGIVTALLKARNAK